MQIGAKEFDFKNKTYLMGILNVTPDSFSDGGLYLDPERAVDRALPMEGGGADIIDLGGESSRPGSDPVPADEEIRRILPVLKKIVPRLKVPVSVDTYKVKVAEVAIGEGVSLVNDLTALRDPKMAELISKEKVPAILMHMRGDPKTMQQDVFYEDVIAEISRFLKERILYAVKEGISPQKILIDPGIGFGKRVEDNWEILKRLEEFKKLECPIVFGSSRKSFLRKALGEDPREVLAGSLATALLAAERGATLLRVHDVRVTKELILRTERRKVTP